MTDQVHGRRVGRQHAFTQLLDRRREAGEDARVVHRLDAVAGLVQAPRQIRQRDAAHPDAVQQDHMFAQRGTPRHPGDACVPAAPRAARHVAVPGDVRSLLLRLHHAHVQLGELRGGHGGRRGRHQILRARRLREGDDVADRIGTRDQRSDAVDAEGDAAVRRRTELQRFEQEAELQLRLVRADAEQTSNTALCMSGRWMRIEPPPISLPLRTMS